MWSIDLDKIIKALQAEAGQCIYEIKADGDRMKKERDWPCLQTLEVGSASLYLHIQVLYNQPTGLIICISHLCAALNDAVLDSMLTPSMCFCHLVLLDVNA